MSSNTETRGAWLWRKMAACFGERFYAMWRNVDEIEMQAMWTEGLRGMSRESLTRGVSAMMHRRTPPTLGEFIEFCEPQPTMYRPNQFALDAPRTPPAEAREQLAKIHEVASRLLSQHGAPLGGGIRWAYRLLQRAANGDHITQHQIDFAKDAIENYNRSHGRHDTRQPGDDDEVTQ
jgi:hypothetical protein